jgi:L-lactate dehydrogenase (cytochrome)
LEIYVDGGLRDGADVLKALCLGATAVGVGRPYFYAMAAYGIEGVEKCTDSTLFYSARCFWTFTNSFPVLAEEVEITMNMLGVSSLDQLRPDMVNASRLLNEMWRPDIWWNKSKL